LIAILTRLHAESDPTYSNVTINAMKLVGELLDPINLEVKMIKVYNPRRLHGLKHMDRQTTFRLNGFYQLKDLQFDFNKPNKLTKTLREQHFHLKYIRDAQEGRLKLTLLEHIVKFLVSDASHTKTNIVQKFDYIRTKTDPVHSPDGEVIKKTLRCKLILYLIGLGLI